MTSPNPLLKHHKIWCDVYIAFDKGLARSLNFNRCQSVMVASGCWRGPLLAWLEMSKALLLLYLKRFIPQTESWIRTPRAIGDCVRWFCPVDYGPSAGPLSTSPLFQHLQKCLPFRLPNAIQLPLTLSLVRQRYRSSPLVSIFFLRLFWFLLVQCPFLFLPRNTSSV